MTTTRSQIARAILLVSVLMSLVAAGCSRDQSAGGAARVAAPIPDAADVTRRLLQTGERARPVQSEATIVVHVALSPKVMANAKPDDTVFVFARADEGPRMPLAIVRGQVKDLPATVRLDDSMAMTPNLKLSDVKRVVVGARVSKSGDANPQPGDLEGFSAPVDTQTSAPIQVTIDRMVATTSTPRAPQPAIAPPGVDHAAVGMRSKLDIPAEVTAKWKSVELTVVSASGKKKSARLTIGDSVAVPDTNLTVRAVAFVPSFDASDGRVTSRSNELDNPAVLVKLTQRDQVVAEGWIFQKFPQFNTFLTDKIQVSLTGAK